MMDQFFTYAGRGDCQLANENIYHVEPDVGAVLLITTTIGKIEFKLAYCRSAFIEKWGCYTFGSFRRASSPNLDITWAVPTESELMIFHSVDVYLVPEEEWMRQSN
jgi:hypothetical protein